jgi:hypothetical protein
MYNICSTTKQLVHQHKHYVFLLDIEQVLFFTMILFTFLDSCSNLFVSQLAVYFYLKLINYNGRENTVFCKHRKFHTDKVFL